MARKNALAKIFLYGMLELGALAGVPIRPDDIEALARQMNGTQVVELRKRDDDGDPPERVPRRRRDRKRGSPGRR
ncbi:MAG TPA: hypothetical protein VGV61_14965 [Thermoanaerobaculia bacterium]|nr:hypothetical protein [Thermoanaerobaculia bacterium]